MLHGRPGARCSSQWDWACALALQNLEQNVPRTDWDCNSQPHEEAASFLVSSVSKSSVSFRRKAASLETKKTGALGEDAGLFECFATVADYSAAPAVSASAAA